MKRIACVGNLVRNNDSDHSGDIVGLFNDIRAFHSEGTLCGLFLVYENSFLQILEGESQGIANAVYKVRKDPRLEDCHIILNEGIEQPYFSHWKVKFYRPHMERHRALLKELDSGILSQCNFDSSAARRCYETFFPESFDLPILTEVCNPQPETGTQEADSDSGIIDYRSFSYSISCWPKPGQVKLSPQIMRSCSLLSKQRISYDDLLQRGLWCDESDLQCFLQQMIKLGVMKTYKAEAPGSKVHQLDTSAKTEPQPPTPHKPADRFGALMRKFLTSARHAG